MTREDLRQMFESFPSAAKENAASRLSLPGAQNKVGLTHDSSKDMSCGWMRPKGWSATTHILKTSHILSVPEVEYLCMSAASICGIKTAGVTLADVGAPVVAVCRFDRSIHGTGRDISVARLHQEDFAQANCKPNCICDRGGVRKRSGLRIDRLRCRGSYRRYAPAPGGTRGILSRATVDRKLEYRPKS